MLQLVGSFLMQRDFRDASTALVTDVASQLGCDRVTLASLERGRLRVEAVSHARSSMRARTCSPPRSGDDRGARPGEAVVHPPSARSGWW
jgi:hypothetical protein